MTGRYGGGSRDPRFWRVIDGDEPVLETESASGLARNRFDVSEAFTNGLQGALTWADGRLAATARIVTREQP